VLQKYANVYKEKLPEWDEKGRAEYRKKQGMNAVEIPKLLES
jgi:hypothetical protein